MIVTVKNMHQITHEFDVDINISLVDFHKQVCEKFDYENARLIYSGRIMNLTDNLSQYMKETDRGFVVVMKVNTSTNTNVNPTYTSLNTINTSLNTINTSLNTTNTSSTQAQINAPQTIPPQTIPPQTIPPQTIPPQTITPQTIQSRIPIMSIAPTTNNQTTNNQTTNNQTTNNEPTYNVRQVRATLIGLLRFISTNQLLNYTYFTSPNDFYHIMQSDTFVDVIQQILNSSTEIADTLDGNGDMNIEINHPVTREPTQVNRETNNANIETNHTNREQPTEFTEEDINNIQTLVSFGYTEQHAAVVYVMAHKNLNLAASLLLDL
jgi:hypothetical protein